MDAKSDRGRPTKYTPEIVVKLCKWVQEGNCFKDACAREGIHYDTFNEWRRQYSDFSDAIKRAEVICKGNLIQIILKTGEKSWQAAAWFLERRYPKEFSLQYREEAQEEKIIPIDLLKEVEKRIKKFAEPPKNVEANYISHCALVQN